MGNLVTLSAEELDNRRTPTSTAELPTERDNDAALALAARDLVMSRGLRARGTSHTFRFNSKLLLYRPTSILILNIVVFTSH